MNRSLTLSAILLSLSFPGIFLGADGTPLPGPAAGVAPQIAFGSPGTTITPTTERERPRVGLEVPEGEMDLLKASAPYVATTGGREIHRGDTKAPSILAPSQITTFGGNGPNGWIPYDATIAVGPNHILAMTNAMWSVRSKSGALLLTQPFSTWWNSPAGMPFDPKGFYDAAAGRFVIMAVSMSSSQAFYHVSVSQTSDPTGAWFTYQLDATLDGSTATGNWSDFPGLGFDNNAVYITSNQFSRSTNTFQYAKIRVLSKAALYSGTTITWTDFTAMHNANGSLAFTLQPARPLTSETSEYLVNNNSGGSNFVTLWRIDNAPSTPSLVRQAVLTVNSYSVPPDATQPGTTALLSTGDGRMFDVVWQNGILHADFNEAFSGLAAIRYLRIDTGSNTVLKDITYTATGANLYYPAVGLDSASNLYLVFNRSSSTEYASVYQTGMLTTDTAIEPMALVKAGVAPNTSGRWGDYSGIATDPVNTLALWGCGGWANTTNNWATQIAQFSFNSTPPPAPTLTSLTPSSGTAGTSVPVTLTGTNFASGASVNISGTGVSPTAVSVASSTQITATLVIASTAAAGPYNVTVTTSGGTSNAAVFTVTTATGGFTPIRVNVGGAAYTDTLGQAWTADADSNGLGGIASTTTTIAGTADQPLYRTWRWGPSSGTPLTFTFPNIPNGTYTATLKFDETLFTAPGQRVFNVVANGQAVLSNFDIFQAAGARNTAVDRQVPVSVSNGQIVIQFVAVVSNPKICAIEIVASGGTAPALTSITPSSGVQGTSVPVTLAGSNLTGATVSVTGSGITVSNVSSTATQVTATFGIAGNAGTGAQNVTVTTVAGTSNAVAFTVLPPAPALTSITPSSGTSGASVNVTLAGSNLSGASVAVSGAGITVTNVASTATQVTATFGIAGNATGGARNVTVSTAGGASNALTFTVLAPPTLTSITPSGGNAGTSVNVTLAGANLSGASVAVSGAGITVTNVASTASQITAAFGIAANAAVGPYSVTASTSAGTSNAVAFNVTSGSATFTPIRIDAGSTTAYTDPLGIVWAADSGYTGSGGLVTNNGTVTGTSAPLLYSTGHWGSNTSTLTYQFAVPNGSYTVNLKFLEPLYTSAGQRVFNVVLNGQTVLPNFDIFAQAGASLQALDKSFPLSVTNGFVTLQLIAVTGNPRISAIEIVGGTPPAPAVASISPAAGTHGTSVPVTLTGTNLNTDVVINAGPNIKVGNITVVSATQVNATFTIASTAPAGPVNATLTTVGGAAAPVTFTIQ